MAHLNDIKDRIQSVKKTRKMTQAMKMVAAAKFKRFSKLAVASRRILSEIDGAITQVTTQENGLVDVPLMTDVSSDKELFIIISGDRGLCGGFNANILKYASELIQNSDKDVNVCLIGRKGVQFFKKDDLTVISSIENFQDKLSLETVTALMDQCLEWFDSGQYAKISLVFNEFKSAVNSNLICKQLLPVNWSEDDDSEGDADIIVEPSSDDVLSALCEKYVKFSLYSAFLESVAAEQGARMAAMDAATDNAGDMINDLTLLYNRQRQAQITTELSEIVAGAEALVN